MLMMIREMIQIIIVFYFLDSPEKSSSPASLARCSILTLTKNLKSFQKLMSTKASTKKERILKAWNIGLNLRLSENF